MVTWQVVANANVVVTFDGDEMQMWQHFQTQGYGVAALGNLRLSGISGSELAGTNEETKKTRHLSLAEAYYAAAIDGVLPVDEPLIHAWEKFERSSVTFKTHFVVYQHFRRLGWTPKSGLNYGAHFVLYRGSAAEFHSEYVVYVQEDSEASSWNTLQSLTRIAADVKKTVLLCTVATAQAVASSDDSPLDNGDTGVYSFHDAQYTVEVIAIRFWDASAADGPNSYTFQPQPILPKKVKNANRKTNVKRPKRELENEVIKSSGNL